MRNAAGAARTARVRWLAGLSAFLALGPVASARDIWVDEASTVAACNDDSAGETAQHPLCTLAACLDRASVPGDRCLLQPGRYLGPAVPRADGTPGSPISVIGFGDRPAEIWGSLPLDGAWQTVGSDLFWTETSLPRPRALLERAPGAAVTRHDGSWGWSS